MNDVLSYASRNWSSSSTTPYGHCAPEDCPAGGGPTAAASARNRRAARRRQTGDRSSCVAGGLVAKKPPLYLGSAAGVSSNGRKMCGYLRERKKAQRRAVSLGSGERDGGPIRLRRARSDTGASTRRQQKDRAAAPRRSVDLARAARAEMAWDGGRGGWPLRPGLRRGAGGRVGVPARYGLSVRELAAWHRPRLGCWPGLGPMCSRWRRGPPVDSGGSADRGRVLPGPACRHRGDRPGPAGAGQAPADRVSRDDRADVFQDLER